MLNIIYGHGDESLRDGEIKIIKVEGMRRQSADIPHMKISHQ